jgi:hypothetical protein
MFSSIRRRLCYANVAATLALVFAMSGGALAAGHYLLTSTSQISPKVLKALKGKSGQRGLAGPAGAAGAKGETGAAGAAGTVGPAGPAGPKGETGAAGAPGATGKEGSPWTAGGTLPAGKSETGVFGDVNNPGAGVRPLVALASFAIPLKAAPTMVVVGVEEGQGEPKENEQAKLENERRARNGEPELPLTIPADCKGNVKAPEAVEGNLCIFLHRTENVNEADLTSPFYDELVASSGVVVGIERPEESEGFALEGSWAVTAK